MKKSKDQIINHLEGLLKEKTADCKFYVICGNVLFFVSIVLGVSLYNMDEKFNERNGSVNSYKRYIIHQEKIEVFKNKCEQLASVSNRPFKVSSRNYFKCVDYDLKEDIRLYSIKEINDAIRHYELGEKGK